MSMDYYLCGECGLGFPDVIEYASCRDCDNRLCDRCRDQRGLGCSLMSAESLEKKKNKDKYDLCPFCSDDIVTTEKELDTTKKLLDFAIEKLGTTLEKLTEEYEAEHNDDDDDEDEDEEFKDDLPREYREDVPGSLTNSIGMKLVPIPAGTFLMGSPEDEKSRSSDELQHEVTLTEDFYLGMTQVTQAQYKEVMGENPSVFQGDKVAGRDSSEFPVETVSWEDAIEFCRRLSEFPNEKRAGRVYRLPTEAEWEYACRAGTDTAYSFGDSSEELSEHAWLGENSEDRSHPVALKRPNAWGLYDMHGNIYEWCNDRKGDYPESAVTDPVGAAEGSGRVYRGGSFHSSAGLCRSALRSRYVPSARGGHLGFRLALSSSGIPK